jgi:mannitol-1-phosphate/altronate dehydrogenase
LNGAHTSFVSLAILAGCRTVREAVEHPVLGTFLRSALLDEIVPSLDVPGARVSRGDVLGRFANPYLQHQLWDITLQGTTKFGCASCRASSITCVRRGAFLARSRSDSRGSSRCNRARSGRAPSRGRFRTGRRRR